MIRRVQALYDFECRLFNVINSHFNKRVLNIFFRSITHLGGASFLITSVLLLMFFSTGQIRITAISSAFALTISHLPVHFVKKMYPRKRPYLILKNVHFPRNPLKDHSFPSGHTTAIWSVAIPFVLFLPLFAVILLPLAVFIGLSRIYLGLHYPSDVIAGSILGVGCGFLSFYLLNG